MSGDLDSFRFGKGHFLPWFELPNQIGQTREIQLYGGSCLLLCLLPANSDKLAELIRARAAIRTELKPSGLDIVFVVRCDVEGAKQLHDKTGASISLWADTDGAVHEFLGATDPDLPRFFLTDPNLKTLDVFDGWQGADFFKQILAVAADFSWADKADGLHPPVLMMPDVLSAELCQRVIDYWADGQKYEGTIGVGKDAQVKADTKIRTDVNVNDRSFLAELDQHIGLSAYSELKKMGDFTVSHRERYKIGCYDSAVGGKYGQHRDTFNLTLANRRYSMSVGLNDDYEGGGLVFPEYSDRVYKLPAGGGMIFPSTLFHRVEPVTAGKRYIMVSFLYDEEGAAFRSHWRGKIDQKDDTERNRLLAVPDISKLAMSRVYTQSRDPRLIGGRASAKAVVAPAAESGEGEPDWKDLARQALDQGLFAKARQYLEKLEEGEATRLRSAIKTKHAQKKTLLVQVAGDSLALPRPWYLKKFDPDTNPFLSTTYFDTWPRLLEDHLATRHPDFKVRVDTNMSQRAFKVTSLVARAPDIFSYSAPDAVILQLGVVDCWRRGDNLDQQDVPIDQFEAKLRQLLQYRARACPTTPVVMVGICPTDLKLYKRNTGMNEVIHDYNTVIRAVAAEYDHTAYVDMETYFDPEDPYSLLHLDGIHLSNSGHDFLAKLLAPVLDDMLNHSAEDI